MKLFILFYCFLTVYGGFNIPGCKENPNGDFNTDSDYSFVPDLSVVSIVVGIIIIIIATASVLPQYIKFFCKRNSGGISPFFLLIQVINLISLASNMTITNATYMVSCKYIGTKQCFPALLSWIQAVLGSFVYVPQILLYFIFYPKKSEWVLFKFPLLITPIVIGCSILFYCSVPILIFTSGYCGNVTSVFGYTYGIISTICVVLQWMPQIVMTFRRKGAGALSIVMLSITGPGIAIMTCYYIFITKQPFSTWISTAAASAQQLFLLGMLIYYELIMKKLCKKNLEKKEDENGSHSSINKLTSEELNNTTLDVNDISEVEMTPQIPLEINKNSDSIDIEEIDVNMADVLIDETNNIILDNNNVNSNDQKEYIK
ncbi:PQ loop repeat protein [Entamoeba marina]